jgi:hypothetical protein
MKYAVEMGSGAMIYIQSFVKLGSDIEKLIGLRSNAIKFCSINSAVTIVDIVYYSR